MSSAEDETASVFYNSQRAVPTTFVITQLGYPQPSTPLKTDNETTNNFIHDNITQNLSKFWDLRFYWLRDQKAQGNFNFFWAKSEENHGDSSAKHRYVTDKVTDSLSNLSYHRAILPRYVADKFSEQPNPIYASLHLR